MDILGLKEYLHCDDAFLKSINQKIVEEVKKIKKNIEKAATEENWQTVKLNAHKMLSSVKIFEMNELVSLLEKIEINANSKNNIPGLKKDIENLYIQVEKVIPEMQLASEKLQ